MDEFIRQSREYKRFLISNLNKLSMGFPLNKDSPRAALPLVIRRRNGGRVLESASLGAFKYRATMDGRKKEIW